jgi:hypothetical protein
VLAVAVNEGLLVYVCDEDSDRDGSRASSHACRRCSSPSGRCGSSPQEERRTATENRPATLTEDGALYQLHQ